MKNPYSPYVLYRRGTLPFGRLESLVLERTWRLAGENDQIRMSVNAQAEVVSAHLHALIPTLDREERASAIRLRRRVHNFDVEAVELWLQGGTALPAALLSELNIWTSLSATLAEHDCVLDKTYRAESEATETALIEAINSEHILRGLQLSGDQLYRDVAKFLADPARRLKNSKRANLISTLTSFAYRVSMKPSPFGSFAEVGAFEPDFKSETRKAPREIRSASSHVLLNRFILNWMEAGCALLDDGDVISKLYLNDAAGPNHERFMLVTGTSGLGAAGSMQSRVVALQPDKLLLALLEVLRHGPRSVDDVLLAIEHAEPSEEVRRDFIQGCVRAGVIFRGGAVPDQATDYADRLLQTFQGTEGGSAEQVCRYLGDLRKLERDFGDASRLERAELLAQGADAVRGFAEVAKLPQLPPGTVKTLVYEDVSTSSDPQSWDGTAVAEASEALGLLSRVVPLVDPASTRRVSLYSLFLHTFGTDPQPLLSVFDAYSKVSESDLHTAFSLPDNEASARLIGSRRRLFDYLSRTVTGCGSAEQVELSISGLSNVLTGTRVDNTQGRSTTFRVQFDRSETISSSRVVVNGVHTGYGAFYSRFSSFTGKDPSGWSLESAVKSHLARTRPTQTDLTAVLGLNFNIHAQLVNRELLYPGSVSTGEMHRTYRLSDLTIFPDFESQELRVCVTETGEEIHLLPMNFLIPVGVPPLYQFLLSLSPTTTYRWNLIGDALEGSKQSTEMEFIPRVVLGNVVVDRRAWRFRAAEVPSPQELARADLRGLRTFEQWRAERGLPQEGFFLVQSLEESRMLAGKAQLPQDSAATLAHLRRASVHKPHYFDTRNPLLMQVFGRYLLQRPEAIVTFQECLPGTAQYGTDRTLSGPEEFFIEFNS